MPKVRCVLSYAFCDKFHTLSSSAKKFKNRLRFDKVTESSKVGTFFETQCTITFHLVVECSVTACRMTLLCLCESISRACNDCSATSMHSIVFSCCHQHTQMSHNTITNADKFTFKSFTLYKDKVLHVQLIT